MKIVPHATRTRVSPRCFMTRLRVTDLGTPALGDGDLPREAIADQLHRVQLPVLHPQIADVGLDAQGTPRHALDQLRRRELTAVLVDLLFQPVVQRAEFSPFDLAGDLRTGTAGGLEDL